MDGLEEGTFYMFYVYFKMVAKFSRNGWGQMRLIRVLPADTLKKYFDPILHGARYKTQNTKDLVTAPPIG